MQDQPVQRKFKLSITTLIWIAFIGVIVYQLVSGLTPAAKVIPYSDFKTALNKGQVSSVVVSATDVTGTMNDGTAFTTVRVDDPDLTKTLEAQKVVILGQAPDNGGILGFLLTWGLPLLMMVGLWYFLFARNKGGAGAGGMGSIFSFGK